MRHLTLISVFSLVIVSLPQEANAQAQTVIGNCNIVIGTINGDFSVSAPLCPYANTVKDRKLQLSPIKVLSADAKAIEGQWCASGGRLADLNARTDIRSVADDIFRVFYSSKFEEYMSRYGDILLDEAKPYFATIQKEQESGDYYIFNEQKQLVDVVSLDPDGYSATFYAGRTKDLQKDSKGTSYYRCNKCFVEQLIRFCEADSQYARYHQVPDPFDPSNIQNTLRNKAIHEDFCNTEKNGSEEDALSLQKTICSTEMLRPVLNEDKYAASVLLYSFSMKPSDLITKSPVSALQKLTGAEKLNEIVQRISLAIRLAQRTADYFAFRGDNITSNTILWKSMPLRWAGNLARRFSFTTEGIFKSQRDTIKQKEALLEEADSNLELTLNIRKDSKFTEVTNLYSAVGFYLYSVALASNGRISEAKEAITFATGILDSLKKHEGWKQESETFELIYFFKSQL